VVAACLAGCEAAAGADGDAASRLRAELVAKPDKRGVWAQHRARPCLPRRGRHPPRNGGSILSRLCWTGCSALHLAAAAVRYVFCVFCVDRAPGRLRRARCLSSRISLAMDSEPAR
jgi:hypothetical protein